MCFTFNVNENGLKGQHIMVPANSFYHGSLHQLHLWIHQGWGKINPDQWRFKHVESSHTLLKFNSSPLKIGHPTRKGSSSKHHFSVAMSVLGMETLRILELATRYIQQIEPFHHLECHSKCPFGQLVSTRKNLESHLQGLSPPLPALSSNFEDMAWRLHQMILTRRPLRRVEIPYLSPKEHLRIGDILKYPPKKNPLDTAEFRKSWGIICAEILKSNLSIRHSNLSHNLPEPSARNRTHMW